MQAVLKEPQTTEQHQPTGVVIPFDPAARDALASLGNLQSAEASLAEQTMAEHQQLRETHPQWFAAYEDISAGTASSEELLELLRSAPTGFAKGMVSGIMAMRLELASVTGRAF